MARSKPLEIVERIVKNMPMTGIRYRFVDTPHGRLYMALGKVETENRYMGLWAFTVGPGVAQDVTFRKDQRMKDCWELLAQTGVGVLEEFAKRHLLEEGAFRAR